MSHDPTEHAQEHIQHEAAHGHGGAANKWITAAALTAAFLAAFAAVSSSLATKHLTESTLKRIEANDKWNEYQSKSIKRSNMDTRGLILNLADAWKVVDQVAKQKTDDITKRKEYGDESVSDSMPRLQKDATALEGESKVHLTTHETYEMSATMFHIAIAVVAIAVVARRKEFWYMSIVGGVVGLYFFGSAYAHAPVEHGEHGEAAVHATVPGAPGGEHGGAAGEHAAPAGEHAAPAGEHAAPAGEHVAPATGRGGGG